MIRYRPEEPQTLEDGPTYDLAVKVADWIEARRTTESVSGWVAGVYGGRGTGKTSFLRTLVTLLKERAGKKVDDAPCVMPTPEQPDDALLTPAATRDHDDLLFLLLKHIEDSYGPAGKEPKDKHLAAHLNEARTADVKRKDLKSFIEYTREINASPAKLPEELVKVHHDAATTTKAIRGAFEKILKALAEPLEQARRSFDASDPLPHRRVLPFFIDDIDLRPDRALELLEIVHLFLNQPRVVVIVTADRDLLLHAIQSALRERGVDHPGLASALLAKYVPYAWSLPVPNHAGRMDEVWPEPPGKKDDEPVLPVWWPEESAFGLGETLASVRARALTMLGELLPPTFRGLVAYHNRLLSLLADLNLAPGAPDLWLALKIRFDWILGLQARLIAPFVSMVAAVDVRHPELRLLEVLNEEPEQLRRVMDRALSRTQIGRDLRIRTPAADQELEEEGLRRIAAALERVATSREESWIRIDDPDEQWPVFDKLRPPHLEGARLGDAWRLLRTLARNWEELGGRTAKEEVPTRFIAVSMRSDAVTESQPIWRGVYKDEDVSAWHVNLRAHVKGQRPTPAEIDAARKEAWERISAQLAVFTGRIVLYANASLSLLLWLGCALDDRRAVIFYNARTKAPFEGPTERLQFPDRGGYEICEIEDTSVLETGGESHAVVLLNFTRAPGDMNHFYGSNGEPVQAKVRVVLRRRSSADIEPQDLVPLLQDVLELVGQLHRDEEIGHLHLAFAGPDAVAFFLGRALKAPGMSVHVYERYGDRHQHVFDLPV